MLSHSPIARQHKVTAWISFPIVRVIAAFSISPSEESPGHWWAAYRERGGEHPLTTAARGLLRRRGTGRQARPISDAVHTPRAIYRFGNVVKS